MLLLNTFLWNSEDVETMSDMEIDCGSVSQISFWLRGTAFKALRGTELERHVKKVGALSAIFPRTLGHDELHQLCFEVERSSHRSVRNCILIAHVLFLQKYVHTILA